MAEQEAVATEESTAAETTETSESPEAVTPQAGTEQVDTKAGYEPFSIPDGFEISAEGSADISEIAKEFGLNQAQAQKMVDKHFDIVSKNNDSIMESKDSTR